MTKHLILPALTLGLVTAGVFIRLVRINVIRTLRDDYIEAARARGIDERQRRLYATRSRTHSCR